MVLCNVFSSAKATNTSDPRLGVKLLEVGVVVLELLPSIVDVIPSAPLVSTPVYSTAVIPTSGPALDTVIELVPALTLSAYQITIATDPPPPLNFVRAV